jgi:hypothetical protein
MEFLLEDVKSLIPVKAVDQCCQSGFLHGQSFTNPFKVLEADQSKFQHPGFEGTLPWPLVCCRNKKRLLEKSGANLLADIF